MRHWFLVVAILLTHVGLLGWSASCHSPTVDEPGHLVAGISHWEFGRYELYRVNPPLVRMVAVLPVLIAGYEPDWSSFQAHPGARPVFAMGGNFVAANGRRTLWLTTLARWACIPLSLIGALVCYVWARDLYGSGAGLLALLLWCASPNILAHASMITPDAAATALGIAACYAFWKWLKKPNWTRTVVAGVALGVAELAKFTLAVFYPLWLVIWLAYRLPERKHLTARRLSRELGLLAVTMCLSLIVINLGYSFEETLKPLGSFEFVSKTFGGEKAAGLSGNRFRGTWLEKLPAPLPANYLRGMDIQRCDFEYMKRPSFLRGEFSKTGWWYYYLYGLAIKVPLGTWLLVLLAAGSRLMSAAGSARWRDRLVLLAPLVVILTLVSSQTAFSHHFRYVLPIFPFAFVWMSQVAQQSSRAVRASALLALLWCVGSSLWVYPHSLSYFNELVGGPRGGRHHMIDSNIGWGQDLLFLEQWMNEHPEAKPLYLVYYGYFDPAHIGIDYDFPKLSSLADDAPGSRPMREPGWYAVSVHFLSGFSWRVSRGRSADWVPKHAFTDLLEQEPTATAGYSIYIYHVSGGKKPEDPQP